VGRPDHQGLRLAGLPFGHWDPSAWKLTHIEGVSRLRLYLADQEPAASWICERAIRHRWAGSGARTRIADGALDFGDGEQVGIELELHVKAAHRYRAAVADVDPAWSAGVWWFVRIDQVGLLQQRLQDAGAGAHHQVVEAPEGVAS
jgi:hypothetical protein